MQTITTYIVYAHVHVRLSVIHYICTGTLYAHAHAHTHQSTDVVTGKLNYSN